MSSVHYKIKGALEDRGIKIAASYITSPSNNLLNGIKIYYYKDPNTPPGKVSILEEYSYTWSKLNPYSAEEIADQIIAVINMEEALE